MTDRTAKAYVRAIGAVQIDWDGLSWARRELKNEALGPAPKDAGQVLARGDVVYVVADNAGHAQLAQLPEAQSALVALDPNDGSVVALVGGFDYFTNKYNRVTQARRLPGSGFKPFLYSAALEHGFTPASVILDAPIVLEGNGSEDDWRPENSTREFGGPTRLREALVRSRNLVSIRILKELGISTAIDYITRFGFDAKALPHDLTLALGTMEVTPLDLASAYAVFANGGYRVNPYFIERIEDASGQVVWRAAPRRACPQCEPGRSRPARGRGRRRSASTMTPHARAAGAAASRGGRTARHHRPECLRHGRHDGGRDQARHRPARAGTEPQRHRRQDRHHQRGQGHLVQRLHAEPGGHRVGRIRPGTPARRGRGRCAHRPADLDRVHARGTQGRGRAAPADAAMAS